MKKVDNFYFRSLLFVILSMGGAGLNYLVYPFLSRIFTIQEFGDYVAIIGLSSQLMGVLLAFSVISIGLVKQYGESEAEKHAQTIQKILLWLFFILALLFLTISPYLQSLLHITSLPALIILSLIMLLSIPSNIWTGYLQAHKEQIRVGVFNFSSAMFKFIAILTMSNISGVIGGVTGFLVGSLLGLLLVVVLPGKRVPSLSTLFKAVNKTERAFLSEQLSFILKSVFVVASLVFLQNYDLVRAKAVFSPDIAGIYGGISVLSNALYYVAFLLVWIILPEFDAKNKQNNKRVLHTAYRLISILAVIAVGAAIFGGSKLLPLILGDSFKTNGLTLAFAILYQISLVSISLYAFYLLIMRKQGSVLLAGLVLTLCLVFPNYFASNPFEMIRNLWAATITAIFMYVPLHHITKPRRFSKS